MTPEQIAALAAGLSETLGQPVDPTPEGVSSALDMLKEQVMAMADAAQSADAADETADAASDLNAIKSALGLTDDSAIEDTINAIAALKRAVVPQHQPVRVDTFADAVKSVQSTKRHTVPHASKGVRGAPAFVGRADTPTLGGMLRDLRAGKSMSYQIGSSGGYLLNHEVANEIIPSLRAATPLFDMGVESWDMDGTETLSIPKENPNEYAAYWVAEGTEIPDSSETVGSILLYPRPLAARVILPNKMIENATVNMEQRIREKFAQRFAEAIMRAALFGTGGVTGATNTGAEPLGLMNVPGVNITALGSGDGAVPTISDLVNSIGRIEDENINASNTWSWLFSPRTKRTFTALSDAEGRPLLRETWAENEMGTLLGLGYQTSTIIPNNITTGSSDITSHIFLGDWQYMVMGMSNAMEVMVNPYSRMSHLQTEIIAVTYVDVAVKYAEAFDVLSGVLA